MRSRLQAWPGKHAREGVGGDAGSGDYQEESSATAAQGGLSQSCCRGRTVPLTLRTARASSSRAQAWQPGSPLLHAHSWGRKRQVEALSDQRRGLLELVGSGQGGDEFQWKEAAYFTEKEGGMGGTPLFQCVLMVRDGRSSIIAPASRAPRSQ